MILAFVAISTRGLVSFFDGGHELRWVALGLLLAFGALLVWSNWPTARQVFWSAYGYIALQTVVVLSLQLLPPNFDFFAILFFILAVQAILLFPLKTGFLWIVVFTVVMAGALVSSYELSKSLPLVMVYASGYFFFGAFAMGTAQAEAARGESHKLLKQLQEAHEELREYASRAEEAAAAQERNRLALELHDSVTQAIFSMTLTADAARIQLDRDSKEVTPQLERLQELAHGALGEMRSLVRELRLPTSTKEGLVPAIRQHLDTLKSQTGLLHSFWSDDRSAFCWRDTRAIVSGPARQALFRVVQEALNNVSKQRPDRFDQAYVSVQDRVDGDVEALQVEDLGSGFDPIHRRVEY